MAVYVDEAIWHWQGRKWCHLLADEEAELHRFAHRLGVHRLSYQGPPKTTAPHYDITGLERDRAVRMGAIACKRAEIVKIFRRVRTPRGANAERKTARPRETAVPLTNRFEMSSARSPS